MNRRRDEVYTETQGCGPDVFLVHGWGMHAGVWRDFSLELAERFRVTWVDLPGHGRSGMIADFDLDGLARALLAVAPERAHWLGWSLGASISLHVARRHPDRVRSLVMLAGNARFGRGEDWPHAMEAALLSQFAETMVRDCHGTLMKFLGLQTFGLDNAREVLKTLRFRVHECAEPEREALLAGLAILRNADLREDLSVLRLPLLLLMGGRDRLVPRDAGQAMQNLAAGAEFHLIDRAAHVPFLTHREACLSILFDFWQRHASDISA